MYADDTTLFRSVQSMTANSRLQIGVQYCIGVAYVVEIKLNSIQFNSNSIQFNTENSNINFENEMNIELGNIGNWLTANKLSLNVQKSKYMIYSKSNKLNS